MEEPSDRRVFIPSDRRVSRKEEQSVRERAERYRGAPSRQACDSSPHSPAEDAVVAIVTCSGVSKPRC